MLFSDSRRTSVGMCSDVHSSTLFNVKHYIVLHQNFPTPPWFFLRLILVIPNTSLKELCLCMVKAECTFCLANIQPFLGYAGKLFLYEFPWISHDFHLNCANKFCEGLHMKFFWSKFHMKITWISWEGFFAFVVICSKSACILP